MTDTERLTKWVIDKIENEYKDDIALLVAVKGHTTDNDGHGEAFDYFVPATERGYGLAQTFMIDGIGYDLYPRSWERVEKSADLEEITFVLANAEILYAKSEGDAERFRALQKKLDDNLHDSVFVYRKALERLEEAMNLYRIFLFEEKSYCARTQVMYIHLYLSQAVAYLNHTFTETPVFTKEQAYGGDEKNSTYHCSGLAAVPDLFFENACQLLKADSVKELTELLHTLICATRKFVFERKPESVQEKKETEKVDYQGLADWYQELSLTWRRLSYFCWEKMVEEAYSEACFLQSELLIVAEEFRLKEMNLADSFLADDLEKLSGRSKELEQEVRKVLAEHHIAVREYKSLNDFMAAEA